jgi:hypothetical protein
MPAPGELEALLTTYQDYYDQLSSKSKSKRVRVRGAPVPPPVPPPAPPVTLTGPSAFRHEIAFQPIEVEGPGAGDGFETRKVGVVAAERVVVDYLLSLDDPHKVRGPDRGRD